MAILDGYAAALVISNVAIIPAIAFAYTRALYAEAALLLAVFAASVAFHLCQVGWFCFGTDVHALQVTDHFMVYTSLLWFSLFFAGAAERARTAVTMGSMAVTLPVIIAFMGTWVSGAIIVALVLTATVVTFTIVIRLHGGLMLSPGPLVLALGLLSTGVVLHVVGGDFGEANWIYPMAHSVWHLLAMLALYYVINIPFRAATRAKNPVTTTNARDRPTSIALNGWDPNMLTAHL